MSEALRRGAMSYLVAIERHRGPAVMIATVLLAVQRLTAPVISKESPVGKALMGHQVGDRVQVEVNPTLKYFVEIRAIEKGQDDESLEISSY